MSSPCTRRRLTVLAVAGALAGVATIAMMLGGPGNQVGMAGDVPGAGATDGPGVPSPPAPPRQPSMSLPQVSSVDAAIARLRAVAPVTARTSAQHPPVSDQSRQQPDLYAAAFTRHLLTQDYRTSREDLLAWVQSESARSTEPTVVGLTPPALRHKLAVASVQDTAAGPAPVPSPAQWAALGDLDGHTTVRIQRVFTPPTWTAAVAAGKVTDAGVTAREVDAHLTVHTVDNGRPRTSEYDVALTMNLQGPPGRDGYGFVTAVTYHVVSGG